VSALLLACAGVAWVAAADGTSATVRYRVTVSFEFRSQSYTVSTVWEANLRARNSLISTAGGIKSDVIGQAMVMDLPGGGYLFLSRRDAAKGTASHIADGSYLIQCGKRHGRDWEADVRFLADYKSGCSVPYGHPLVVLATGDADAPTLTRIDYDDRYSSTPDHLRLRSLVVEATDEPVPLDLDHQFPWIDSLPRIEQPGSNIIESDSRLLYREDFLRERHR
jgi:hypothetical protein